MSEDERWTVEELARAIDHARARVDKERRAQFAPFGIPPDCLWPASRVYHQQSALGPAWNPTLTVEEVEVLTRDFQYKRYPGSERTSLPDPAPLIADLERTIRSRRSRSEFSDRHIDLRTMATLLALGSGVTQVDDVPRRAAPSGGALYPVETYALSFAVEDLAPGVYHYDPLAHALEHVQSLSGREVMKPFLPPRLLEGGPTLVLVLSAVFGRTQKKYLERGYRFALLEAGHIAQNILLTATALGLGAVPVGGFWDEPLNDLMGFDAPEEAVVYSVLLGHLPPV